LTNGLRLAFSFPFYRRRGGRTYYPRDPLSTRRAG